MSDIIFTKTDIVFLHVCSNKIHYKQRYNADGYTPKNNLRFFS